MKNPSLDIIVTEHCSTGGFPLKEACEHCYLIQSAISVAISYIISVYCEDYAGYFTVILSFLAFRFCSAYLYIWYLASGIRALSLAEIVGIFFSRVETYSGVFKPHRSVITRINPRLRDSYTQEIQVVLKRTYVGHPCNPCWYPFEW